MHASRRPPVWLLLLLTVIFLFQMGSIVTALQTPESIEGVVSFPPLVQLVTGVTWAVLFAWGIIRVFRLAPLGIMYSLWLIALFILYSLLRLLIFTTADYDRQRLPFLLALFLLLTIIGMGARLLWVKMRYDHNNGENTYDR